MTLPLEENIRQVLKDFNLSEFNVREGFIFLSRSPIEWTEEQLIPEVFNDCLMDPERPERESLLSLSALYQDGCIERRLPNDLLTLSACAVMVTAISRTREAAAIWESPRATAKEFVRAAKILGILPTDSERVFERLAERVCEIKARTYVGVIVHPIEIEIGIPFEELRDRILSRLSPELRTGLNAEYDRQKALEIPSTLYEFLDKADRSTTRPVHTTTSTIQAQPADIEKGEPQSQKQGLTTIEVARRLSL